ncbi:hypothetical protein AB0N09_40590 [Streptomyces erythrochromogenes]|uniref:hypothetical protein n=1 Tax=Streptomyces erythrochromogenes TaxID=285574 RepID=UPI003430B704
MKRSRVFGAAGLTLVLAASAPGFAAGAAGAPGGEAVIVEAPSVKAPKRQLAAAGTGLQMQPEVNGAPYWRSLKDGKETGSDYCNASHYAWTLRLGDMEACTPRAGSGLGDSLHIRDFATQTAESLPGQPNRTWLPAVSATQVLTTEKRADGTLALHLLGRGNEPRKDVLVATSERIDGQVSVKEADARGALLRYQGPAGMRLGLVDYASATMRALPLPAEASALGDIPAGLGRQWTAVFAGKDKISLVSRTGTAASRTITAVGAYGYLHQTGDWVINARGGFSSSELVAYPLAGGTARTVLPALATDPVAGTDGNLYAIGGPDRYHWGIHRISLNAQGVPVAEELEPLPSQPVQRYGPTLTHGELTIRQIDDFEHSTHAYRASVAGPMTVPATPAWSCSIMHDLICSHPSWDVGWATGDGRLVSATPGVQSNCLETACNSDFLVQEARPGGARRTFPLSTPATGPLRVAEVKAVSGRYAVIWAIATVDRQARGFVVDIDAGKVLDVKVDATGVFSLWGSLLWRPDGDSGAVAATDLRTGQITKRVDLRTGCRAGELQVTGDWFYTWCSRNAANYTYSAFHAPTGKAFPLPFADTERSEAKLGDGYVVNQTRNGLYLYNLRSGAVVREHTAYLPTYWRQWTVDRFGGGVAYIDDTDAKDEVHVVGVTGKSSPLTVIDQSIPATVKAKSTTSGNTRWWLSKPAASWKLTVRDTDSGITSVIRSGGEARGLIDVAWNGTDQNGKRLYGGVHEWTLTVQPADGGAALKSTGTLTFASAGSAARPPQQRP